MKFSEFTLLCLVSYLKFSQYYYLNKLLFCDYSILIHISLDICMYPVSVFKKWISIAFLHSLLLILIFYFQTTVLISFKSVGIYSLFISPLEISISNKYVKTYIQKIIINYNNFLIYYHDYCISKCNNFKEFNNGIRIYGSPYSCTWNTERVNNYLVHTDRGYICMTKSVSFLQREPSVWLTKTTTITR